MLVRAPVLGAITVQTQHSHFACVTIASPSNMPNYARQRHFAVIGAGLAGITCARTLAQAGHQVQLFEKSRGFGGRMATRNGPFGSFDHGAQYFTQRDPRFVKALASTPGVCKTWTDAVHNFDGQGRFSSVSAHNEAHLMPTPRMNALPQQWARPLVEQGHVSLQTRVLRIESLQPNGWQLHFEGPDGGNYSKSGFDGVLLALPAPQTRELLAGAGGIEVLKSWVSRLDSVTFSPCWTLMLSFDRENMNANGPLWNAARSKFHSIAWIARESSKPDRGQAVERWTLQASSAWSEKHFETDKRDVHKLLTQAFADITGIVSEPTQVDSQRWRYSQTVTPLGQSHLWQPDLGIGVCGDWCLGHRVECAYVSGLELAQAVA